MSSLQFVLLYGRIFVRLRDKKQIVDEAINGHFVDLVATGAIDPTMVLTQTEPLVDAIEAYKAFDRRESAWVKVELRSEARKAA